MLVMLWGGVRERQADGDEARMTDGARVAFEGRLLLRSSTISITAPSRDWRINRH